LRDKIAKRLVNIIYSSGYIKRLYFVEQNGTLPFNCMFPQLVYHHELSLHVTCNMLSSYKVN